MVGLPIVPVERIPEKAAAVFLPIHAAHEPNAAGKIQRLIATGATVLVTDGLVAKLPGAINLDAANVHVLTVGGDPYSLLKWSDEQVAQLRETMLAPLGIRLTGPQRVAMYLFGDDLVAIESFNDESANAGLAIRGFLDAECELALPSAAKTKLLFDGGVTSFTLSPRSMVLLRMK
jgi:hypothetical protein